MYISITGLKLKSKLHLLKFMRHAIPSFRQAQNATGNLFCETRTIDGVHHTLTAWETKKAMKAYLASGAHLKAMGSFDDIATGAVYGYEAEAVPSWEDALTLWHEKGRGVGQG